MQDLQDRPCSMDDTNIIDQHDTDDIKNTIHDNSNSKKPALVGMSSLLSTKSASLSNINRSNSKVMPRNNRSFSVVGDNNSSIVAYSSNNAKYKKGRLVFLQKSPSFSLRTTTTSNTTSTVSTYLSKSINNLLGSVVHLRKNNNNNNNNKKNDDSLQRCSTTQEESSSQSSHNNKQQDDVSSSPLIATTTTTTTVKHDNKLGGGDDSIVIETRVDELPKILELPEQQYHQQEQSSSSESTTHTKLSSTTITNDLPSTTTAESSSSTQQQQQQQQPHNHQQQPHNHHQQQQQQQDEQHQQPPFIPGTALHIACQNDSPVDHVRGLLYMFPDSINAIDETTGKTPWEVVRDISRLCTCGYCNYNRTLVLEALEKGADFYRRRRRRGGGGGGDLASYNLRDNNNDDNDDDYSIASDTSTNAHYGDNTRFYSTWNDGISSTSSICFWSNDSRKSSTTRNNAAAADDNHHPSSILNLSDLSLQKQSHYSTTLLSHRRTLYLHHHRTLSSLRREITLLQTEERSILREINQRKILMTKLHARNENDDDHAEIDYLSRTIQEKFQEYKKMQKNYDFKIGITRIDSYNMTRYLNEVMDERRRLEVYWERYYGGVFGEVDERIRRALGDSALRCCRNMQSWS